MTTIETRACLALLAASLLASTAWSGQGVTATSSAESAGAIQAAQPATHASADKARVPAIVDEEEIPAFLRTDMCDTGDS